MNTPSQPFASAATASSSGTRGSENEPMFARQIPQRMPHPRRPPLEDVPSFRV